MNSEQLENVKDNLGGGEQREVNMGEKMERQICRAEENQRVGGVASG